MKHTATIEILIETNIEAIVRKGFILKRKKFPENILAKIELVFGEHTTRRKEKHLIYEGEMQLNTTRCYYDSIGDIIPQYDYSYSIPALQAREKILGKIHTILIEYQNKGWDTHKLSLVCERLKYGLDYPIFGVYSKAYGSWLVETFDVIKKGEVYMEGSSKYKIEGQMQIGQIGDNNAINQLAQNLEYSTTNIDFRALRMELEKLRETATQNIKSADDAIALGAIANAEKEAENLNEKGVLEYLAKAGNWGLDIAVKIGLPVATEAIKRALEI